MRSPGQLLRLLFNHDDLHSDLQALSLSLSLAGVWACCGRYGVLVLVVEVMGASTVVLYGINLLFLPAAPVYHPDPARPGLPRVRLSSLPF